jgi:mono/diheme cytochrome c family protein
MGPAAGIAANDGDPPPGTYRIVDGKLDKGAYAGWFIYHLSCFMCHGQDAMGSDVAPDLRKSMKTMSQIQFANKVLVRYRILGIPGGPPTEALRDSVRDEVLHQRRGPAGTLRMPVFPDDPGMKPHVLDLYAYLKARSDNAIGPGRPATAER